MAIEFDNWPLELGFHLTNDDARKVQAFIYLYHKCFVFSLHDLEGYKEKPIYIQLHDDHLIFQRPYRLNVPRELPSRLVGEALGSKAD